jgi:hypothetical protein
MELITRKQLAKEFHQEYRAKQHDNIWLISYVGAYQNTNKKTGLKIKTIYTTMKTQELISGKDLSSEVFENYIQNFLFRYPSEKYNSVVIQINSHQYLLIRNTKQIF